jgi:hypothetical protein
VNTQLVEYGIQNEQSDLRAHVCPKCQEVYVFPTLVGRSLISGGAFPMVKGRQNGLVTAEGYLVPPEEIPECRTVEPPVHWWGVLDIRDTDDLGSKGKKAVNLVRWMLLKGVFPLWFVHTEITDKNIQIKGLDIYVNANCRIQVKCDFPGGRSTRGGSGNLFIQVRECNPFGIY